jgi:hypothetical protein
MLFRIWIRYGWPPSRPVVNTARTKDFIKFNKLDAAAVSACSTSAGFRVLGTTERYIWSKSKTLQEEAKAPCRGRH